MTPPTDGRPRSSAPVAACPLREPGSRGSPHDDAPGRPRHRRPGALTEALLLLPLARNCQELAVFRPGVRRLNPGRCPAPRPAASYGRLGTQVRKRRVGHVPPPPPFRPSPFKPDSRCARPGASPPGPPRRLVTPYSYSSNTLLSAQLHDQESEARIQHPEHLERRSRAHNYPKTVDVELGDRVVPVARAPARTGVL